MQQDDGSFSVYELMMMSVRVALVMHFSLHSADGTADSSSM
jgi:hypothetical protein